MGVFDTSTPAGTDPISQGDDNIREFKTGIQEALRGGASEGDEAVFPGSAPLTAPVFRYRGLKGTTGARPSSGQYGFYYNTTKNLLERDNGSTWDAIGVNPETEAVHHAVKGTLASVSGVVTLDETTNSFDVSGTEAVTSIAGWSAGIVVIKWTQARTLTHGASLALKNSLSRSVAAGDISVFEFTAADSVREIGFYGDSDRPAPTRQILLSGSSATYTTPSGCKKLLVEIVGGGGGGGGSTATNGGAGGDTTFNAIVASGGSGGVAATGVGGAGGTGGSGSASARFSGHFGPTSYKPTNANGSAAPANSGLGGGGGCYFSGSRCGGDGGSGERVIYEVTSPSATYTYTVGAGGTGSTGGGDNDGGAGGSGYILVTEFY